MRLTLCREHVDETTAEQRASHALRAAPFCGRCSMVLDRNAALRTAYTEVAFTARGKRRHWVTGAA